MILKNFIFVDCKLAFDKTARDTKRCHELFCQGTDSKMFITLQ